MERAEGTGGGSGGTDGELSRRRLYGVPAHPGALGLWSEEPGGASGGHWDVSGKVTVLQPVLYPQVCGTCCCQGAHG